MALPIAQLGYIPSMHVPQGTSTREAEQSPWSKMAVAVLSQIASQAASNAMSQDYASAATNSNPEVITAGAMIDPGTGKAVPGSAPTKLGAQDAGFFEKILKGPRMNERAYEAEMSRRAGAKEGAANRKNTVDVTGMREKGDTERAKMSTDTTRRGQDIGSYQFNEKMGLDREQMGLLDTQHQERLNASLYGSDPDRQNAATRAAELLRQPSASETSMNNTALGLTKEYNDYSAQVDRQNSNAALMNRGESDPRKHMPIQPKVTPEQFAAAYNSFRSGIKPTK